MSGSAIAIQVNDAEVRQLLARLAERTSNLRPPMAAIGEIVVESVQRNFEEHRSPDGKTWAPLSDRYARWKSTKKGRNLSDILLLNRVLMGSIHHRAERDRVAIGTNIVYGAIHQFGGRTGRGHAATMPARPFLGVRDDDWVEIRDVILKHIKKADR